MISLIMRKVIWILIFSFLGTNSSFSTTSGSGELTLSGKALDGVLHYFDLNAVRNTKGNMTGVPSFFAVSKSGRGYGYTYCPSGQSCVMQPIQALQLCRKRSGERCYVFAKSRRIVWNQINHKISRKASRSDVRFKLEEFGFLGNKKTSNDKDNLKFPKIINSLNSNQRQDWKDYVAYDYKFKAWVMAKRKDGGYSSGWQVTNHSWTTAITKATNRCNKFLKEDPKTYPKETICILYFKGINPTSDDDKIYQAKLYYSDYESDQFFAKYPDVLNNKKEIKPKITKKDSTKKKVDDDNIVKKLKELNELYKSGVLSKEEFDKAKKKVLSN